MGIVRTFIIGIQRALNHLAKHAPLLVHFRQDGLAELIPDIEGIDRVISTLLGIVFTALAAGRGGNFPPIAVPFAKKLRILI